MNIDVLIADYLDKQHSVDIGNLLNEYAEDPMGGGESLPDYVKQNLSAELSKVPSAFSVICYVNGKAAGLTNCFEAFFNFQMQTFAQYS